MSTPQTIEEQFEERGVPKEYADKAIATINRFLQQSKIYLSNLEENAFEVSPGDNMILLMRLLKKFDDYIELLASQGRVQKVYAIIHEVVSGDEFLQTYIKDLVLKATFIDKRNQNQ